MEGNYAVYFGKEQVGKVQVLRQGLYYRFSCRCRLSGNVMYRLWIRCSSYRESLGIIIPMGEGFGLDRKIPVKRIGEGVPEFCLLPQRESIPQTFVSLSVDEPFEYLSQLKSAYLTRKNGQVGISIK